MIEKIIDTYFENIINESEQSGSKELKEIIKMVKQLPDEIAIDFTLRNSVIEITNSYLIHQADEKEVDKLFTNYLYENYHSVMRLSEKYLFKVELKGYEKKLNRLISIPSMASLSDLGISIVLAFHGDFYHLMQFTIGRKVYGTFSESIFENDDRDAREWHLNELHLRKNSKILFEYDFGEGYEFTVKYLGKEEDSSLYPYPYVKDGEGYGIWEDNYGELQLYYDDPNTLVENYEGEMIPVKDMVDFDQEEFDSEEINAYIREYFTECKRNCDNEE